MRLLVAEIDEKGSEGFTTEAIAELEISNPELLQMAHNFASRLRLPARDAGLCALVQVPPGSSKGRSGEAALRGNFVLPIRSPGTKKCSTLLQAMLALQGRFSPPQGPDSSGFAIGEKGCLHSNSSPLEILLTIRSRRALHAFRL